MNMAEPPGTKSGSRLPILYCDRPRLFGDILPELLRSGVARAKNSNAGKDELHRTHGTVFVEWKEMSVLVELHNTRDATIRREVQAIVEHVLSGRPGEWRVSIVGSRAKEDWELKVEGPNGFEPQTTDAISVVRLTLSSGRFATSGRAFLNRVQQSRADIWKLKSGSCNRKSAASRTGSWQCENSGRGGSIGSSGSTAKGWERWSARLRRS
jgi:hypothetical protein